MAKPIIDVMPIPAHTNEIGAFERALDALWKAYRGVELFQPVTYDAGACSAHNATLVRARNLTTYSALPPDNPRSRKTQNAGSAREQRLRQTP